MDLGDFSHESGYFVDLEIFQWLVEAFCGLSILLVCNVNVSDIFVEFSTET